MNLTKEQFFGMYINNNVLIQNEEVFRVGQLQSINLVDNCYFCYLNTIGNYPNQEWKIRDCKLILRTFEDMTEEEKTIYSNLTSDTFDFEVQDSAIQTDYLRSIGVEPNFEHYEKLGYCVRSEK